LKNSRAPNGWTPVYPPTHFKADQDRTRSLILVSPRLNTSNWMDLRVDSPDVTAIQMWGDFGTIQIFNIYNDCDHSRSIEVVRKWYRNPSSASSPPTPAQAPRQPVHTIWLGDFNRHSPLWEEERNKHLFTRGALDKAQQLINLTADYGMEMVLPKNIPTLEVSSTKNWTRADNVFASTSLTERIIKCDVDPYRRPPLADHLPIITEIDVNPAKSEEVERRDWMDVDWMEFRKVLKGELEKMGEPKEIRELSEFKEALRHVERSIEEAVSKTVPFKEPSPFRKRWWTKELTEIRKKFQKAGHKSHRRRMDPNDPIHEIYRQTRNQYTELIKKSKQDHWLQWLEEADSTNIWKVHKLVVEPSSDGGRTRIPVLKEEIGGRVHERITNEDKSQALHKTFFPPPPTQEADYGNEIYPDPVCQFRNITDEQIIRAIDKLKPYKGVMTDDIANVVLKRCKQLITPYLGPIYRATFTLKTYPEHWKIYDTCVTRKPGKPNYTVPKAYRPTCLLRTLGKPLSMATAEYLNYIIEKHDLLPANHFGGRPGRTTTDAIHTMVKYIKDAWRSGKVVAALFLDVKGAFPSVDPKRLEHEMKKRGIPIELVDWVQEKLKGRATVIRFDDFRSLPFAILAGLDQGCALSVTLYNIYNAPLIEIPRPLRSNNEMVIGYVDDVTLLAKGKDFGEANKMLEQMMEREGGALEWAGSSNCEFEIDKFALMGFSRRMIPKPFEPRKRQHTPRFRISVRGHSIKPTQSTRFLGVIMNQTLSWAEQTAAAMAKGMQWAIQCKRIAKPTQGIPMGMVRQLYLSACIPKMLYAVDVWGAEASRRDTKRKYGGQLGKLERVHRQALLMLGAMRTTPTDVLEVHVNIMPFHLLVDKMRHGALLRMATLPESNPISSNLARAHRVHVKRHQTPLHRLLATYRDVKPGKLEKVQTIRRPPYWKPKYDTYIQRDAKKAKERAELRREDIQIFTDGSGYEGGIGAAATIWRQGQRQGQRERTLQLHLGSDRQQIVYGGEVAGLILAMELLRTETRPFNSVFIGVDNQAAIQATKSHKRAPGQYLMDEFRKSFDAVMKANGNFECQIHWTPGHKGIKRNEAVDERAKEAAQGTSTRTSRLPKALQGSLPLSKSAVKQAYAERIKMRAARFWRRCPRYQRTVKIDKSLPSKKFLSLVQQLPRTKASLLLQLRTGHAPLNKHLHRIHRADSPLCPACQLEEETVHHFIITCPARQKHRTPLEIALRRDARSITKLLTSPKAIPLLFRYIHETGRFRNVFDLGGRNAKNDITMRNSILLRI
jgi:ribonuclease HI